MVGRRVDNDQEVELRSASFPRFQQQLGWLQAPAPLQRLLLQHVGQAAVLEVDQSGRGIGSGGGNQQNGGKQKRARHALDL